MSAAVLVLVAVGFFTSGFFLARATYDPMTGVIERRVTVCDRCGSAHIETRTTGDAPERGEDEGTT